MSEKRKTMLKIRLERSEKRKTMLIRLEWSGKRETMLKIRLGRPH